MVCAGMAGGAGSGRFTATHREPTDPCANNKEQRKTRRDQIPAREAPRSREATAPRSTIRLPPRGAEEVLAQLLQFLDLGVHGCLPSCSSAPDEPSVLLSRFSPRLTRARAV